MSDVVDTLAILGILLVAVWIGFAIMAVQWVLNHLLVVGAVVGVVVLVLAAAVRKQQG
jgi:ABC-type transport system involved in cytochrome bd biosynthesis fused ATPase/permease subunit